MLTVARSFVGGRLMELHVTRRKKYARTKRRDIQFNSDTGKFHCPNCNNGYGRRDTMLGHYRYECGKAPRYKCPYCYLRSKKTSNIYQHVRCMHPKEQVTLVKLYWARDVFATMIANQRDEPKELYFRIILPDCTSVWRIGWREFLFSVFLPTLCKCIYDLNVEVRSRQISEVLCVLREFVLVVSTPEENTHS